MNLRLLILISYHHFMPFDYDAAKARVSKELVVLSEELWADIKPHYEEFHMAVPENKYTGVYYNSDLVKDEVKRSRFFMLYNLNFNAFHSADVYWSEILTALSDEEQAFYANLMIEEAKRSVDKLGYSWIVKVYDNGSLKNYIPEDLLRESVNMGFWEILNTYFTGSVTNPAKERYEILMKYKDILDLTRVEEFKGKKLSSIWGWVYWADEAYIKCFERDRSGLSVETGAWLARPIIDSIIYSALSSEETIENEEGALEKGLQLYKEYLGTAIIQELFIEEFKSDIRSMDCEEAYMHLSHAEIVSKYLKVSKSEFVELVSSNLPLNGSNLHLRLMDNDFPKDWIDEKTLSEIKSQFIAEIEDSRSGEIIPNLYLMQRAARGGWVDDAYARKRIENRLKGYLDLKRTPAGNLVKNLVNNLDPEFVEERLYRDVVHRAIKDLVKRKKIENASELYLKAEKEGWLDKSKIPKFELWAPKPPEPADTYVWMTHRRFRRGQPRTSRPKQRSLPQPGQQSLDKYK
jgi:hypothetical protein